MKWYGWFAIGGAAYLLAKSYNTAINQLQLGISRVGFGNVTSSGQLALQVDLLVTNPTPNPFYFTGATLQMFIETNGGQLHVADLVITQAVTIAGNSVTTVPTDASFDLLSAIPLTTALLNGKPLPVVLKGFVNEGPVGIPINVTTTIQFGALQQ